MNAFLATWSQARAAFGQGAPPDGSEFDQSAQLSQMQDRVRSAAPGSAWSGSASDVYADANSRQAEKLGRISELDQSLGNEVGRSAAVVSAGRRDLDAVKQWVTSAAATVPQMAGGDQLLWPIVRKGSADMAEIVNRSNGELSSIAGRIRGLGGEYDAVGGEAKPAGWKEEPPPPPTDPLDDILRKYQTGEDPGGALDWEPGWPLNEFTDPMHVTATEARMLEDMSPFELRDLNQIKEAAAAEAIERFPPPNGGSDTADNHTDAYRHAYWNALMTQRFGEEWTSDFATAHEGLPGNPATAEAMDLHNNEVGRQIAMANPDANPEELADLVEQAVTNGDTVVIAPSGDRLAYSDDIPQGGAGHTTPNTLPGQPADPTGAGPGGPYDPGQPGGISTGGY
ncbi:DUF6973 domain-containing protein [Mycolicibacterium sediminis]|nr:EspA/EspE family type VII secretion system effector [Mycolicibacterium sediminis]